MRPWLTVVLKYFILPQFKPTLSFNTLLALNISIYWFIQIHKFITSPGFFAGKAVFSQARGQKHPR